MFAARLEVDRKISGIRACEDLLSIYKLLSAITMLKDMEQEKPLNDQFKYLTEDLVDQEFELEIRAKLLKIKSRIKLQTVSKQTWAKGTSLSFSSEFLRTKLSDVLQSVGNPQTTKEFVRRLQRAADSDSASETTTISSGYTADSTNNHVKGLPPKTPGAASASTRVLQAGPSSTAKFTFPPLSEFRNPLTTPLNNNQTPMFGRGDGNHPLLSAIKKTPRAVKPGEPIYTFSATGSPIISTAGPSVIPQSARSARVKLDGGNGKFIDVDLVYRGRAEDEKKFGKLVTDIRGWAATRSAANARRLLPPRVLTNKRKAKSLRRSVKRI